VPQMLVHALMHDRPVWRGRMHSWTFFGLLPAGLVLIVLAEGALARTASAIYVLSVLAVFGTSAAYHRLAQSLKARMVMQRLDHSMIYLLIAGTYVPLCLLVLPPHWGVPLLIVVGVIGLVGMVLKLVAFGRWTWLSYSLYPLMGWAAVVASPALITYLSPTELVLVVAGGLAYTVGLPIFALKKPDPWPRTFGYHEIWHSFTVVAALLHFAAVAHFVL
jgi:hemolysin III